MSKAFTKESETDQGDDQLDQDTHDLLPKGLKNYITPTGAKKLKDELHQLLVIERPEVVRTVSWAASNGDRSENGDYIYGKKRLREIDRRIRFLKKRLDAAEVVDPVTQKNQNSSTILFGATVTVLNESGQKKIYKIVGIDETDGSKGHISWISPIGKALLQHSVGDVITVLTPKGDEEFEVIDISYL